MPNDAQRDKYLRTRYGITLEQFNAILAFQGGVCAVCGRPAPKDRSLHVDHDHRTGRVRGLLCYTCNYQVIRRTRSAELLRAAARYLEHPPADEALLAL